MVNQRQTDGFQLTKSDAKRLGRMMQTEAHRARDLIKAPPHPSPFYVSFLVRDEETWELKASYGSVAILKQLKNRSGFCDMRVGTPQHDQVQDGGLYDNSLDDESYDTLQLPFGGSDKGVLHGLWRQAEVRYREAIEALSMKKAYELTYRNRNRKWPSFQMRAAIKDVCWSEMPRVDVEYWRRFVERTSSIMRRYPEVRDSFVQLNVRNQVRVYANTEGSLQVQCQPLWRLSCDMSLLSKEGDVIDWNVQRFACRADELPDEATFRGQLRDAVRTLRRLAAAPVLRAYAGPVLLAPGPAGLLIHEAIGHRLEGNRLLSSGEGQTFRDMRGKRILPEFLSIYDDPQLETYQDESLVGHYRYDDEGVPARRADLVRKGVLREFLTSRSGITGRHDSNGHGRGEQHERPVSRMGVTVVESHQGMSDEQLKAALLQEIRDQKLPFGIRIMQGTGGETTTEAYDFQAFLGQIDLAAKVYPDGREELVRGVDFVGTPLNAIRGIVGAGQACEVDNAYCGAESGWVPVSTICPSLLVSRLELQSKAQTAYSPPCYPLPW